MLEKIYSLIPEVAPPKKKLDLKTKLLWTLAVLVLYYVLSLIPLYGLNPQYKAQFQTLSILLAASFGSIITLGIGPIVTGSIVLQLLKGADIVHIDINTPEGKKEYQGLQKIFSLFFIIFENAAYVVSGALPPAYPSPAILAIMIFQLAVGGLLIMFMDEVSSKWGIGSGISLFIVAGVAREIFVNAFSPCIQSYQTCVPWPFDQSGLPVGLFFRSIALLGQGLPSEALFALVPIAATIAVFGISIYAQSIKVEIPLSFGRIRGFGMRWPISLLYTSNIPVILTAALIASLEFWGLMLYHAGTPILGSFERQSVSGGGYQEVPTSGLIKYINPPKIRDIISGSATKDAMLSLVVYTTFLLSGSVLFSVLWVSVGGQDPGTVADQIISSGMSIPGFRRDKRVIELMLGRYIMPLAVMGGLTVGFLASFADLFGALSRGTGILLSVMIVYNFYESIMKQHLAEIHPSVRKVLGV